MKPHIIKGCPRDRWAEVQAIQHEPFIYIHHNGSKWLGQEPDDVAVLLDMLAKHSLDWERFDYSFITVNPCRGVQNPKWDIASDRKVPRFINGPRLYACDGVTSFFGNFLTYSHGFQIDTNHKPIIDALTAAIEANKRFITESERVR